MNPWILRNKFERVGAIAILLTIGVVAMVVASPRTGTIQCDGSVPTWLITEENEGVGCVELLTGPPPRDWDGSWICIGLCLEPNPSPYYPSSEP